MFVCVCVVCLWACACACVSLCMCVHAWAWMIFPSWYKEWSYSENKNCLSTTNQNTHYVCLLHPSMLLLSGHAVTQVYWPFELALIMKCSYPYKNTSCIIEGGWECGNEEKKIQVMTLLAWQNLEWRLLQYPSVVLGNLCCVFFFLH